MEGKDARSHGFSGVFAGGKRYWWNKDTGHLHEKDGEKLGKLAGYGARTNQGFKIVSSKSEYESYTPPTDPEEEGPRLLERPKEASLSINEQNLNEAKRVLGNQMSRFVMGGKRYYMRKDTKAVYARDKNDKLGGLVGEFEEYETNKYRIKKQGEEDPLGTE